MKNIGTMDKRYLLVIGCAAALCLTGCDKTKKKATGTDEVLPVDVAIAPVDTVLLSKPYPGTLTAVGSVDIVGRVNGVLLTQDFKDGDMVKKGQLLFTIEDGPYVDAVREAEATLTTAQSQYEYNSKHYDAMQKALASDAVAQIEVLQAKSAVEQSEADIKSAKAALAGAHSNLSYCTIYSPLDGQSNIGAYTPGTYISGADSPVVLATIYDNSQLNANFFIEDASFLRSFVNENGRSKIDYDSVPVIFSETLPHEYKGKLIYLAPDVDTSTGTLHVRCRIQNPYGELKAGMYATINLPYKLEPHAVLVKDASISTSQTNKFLYVVNDSNRIVYTPIEVGEMANDSMRIVTKGLKGGEKYVTKALLKVRPGMEIKPILTK